MHGRSVSLRAPELDSLFPCASRGRPPFIVDDVDDAGGGQVKVAQDDQESLFGWRRWTSGRLSWCPASGFQGRAPLGCRTSEPFSTMTQSLLVMSDWLGGVGGDPGGYGCSDYVKAAVLLLTEQVPDTAGKGQGRQAPSGRPKTDRLDAVWLCKGRRSGRCSAKASCRRPVSGVT
jgi:hypothetical protein